MKVSPRILCLPLVAAWLIFAVDGACQGQPAPSRPARTVATGAKFDTREIKTTAEPGVVELRYEFTNTGEIPLVVEGFSQSCGCMKGEWDGVPVAPGARGSITARLLTRGLRGKVRKSLHVKFVASGEVELIGEVLIPEVLAYSAQTLRWKVGGEPLSKQVDIVANLKTSVKVLSVSANDPAFSCELLAGGDARTWRIVITPRDTNTARVCVLQVRTDSKDPRDALHGLFALVEKTGREGGRP